MPKLHEIIAASKDRLQSANIVLDETQNTFTKKPDHFIGRHSLYRPFDEGSEETEETTKELVDTVSGKLRHCFSLVCKSIDLEISKDVTNQQASAPIVIDGVQITEPLPATSLLLLESKVKQWLVLFATIPTLAPGRRWELDPSKGEGVYVDMLPESRFRTKKVIQHKTLYEATTEHPAQIEKWAEDIRVGKVTDTTWCSMFSPAQKAQLISRTQDLLIAVKEARQRANDQEVTQMAVADGLIAYLLK